MKNLFTVLIASFCLMSCVKDSGSVGAKVAKIQAVETLTTYDVPTRAGAATIVMLGEDTMAVTSQPMTIKVPSYAAKENALKVTYSTDEIYQNFAYAEYWQYVSFEDTRKGDYDYNDIVFHARVRSTRVAYNSNRFITDISIQPVALGSAMPIQIGIVYQDSKGGPLKEKILIQNARAELFFGNPIFPINTDPTKEIKKVTSKLTNFFEIETDQEQNAFGVVWFIVTSSGEKLYAATTNFASSKLDMISPDGLPYGLSMTKKWEYPIEKCHIRNVYPGFDTWIQTGDESVLLSTKVTKFAFPAIPPKSEGEDLWDWEK